MFVRHPELKYTTTALIDATLDSAGTVTALWAPTVGAAIDNVVGKTAQIRSVYMRGFVSAITTATAAYVAPLVRLVIFVDKAVTEETPTVTAAADATTGVLDSATVQSPLHINTKGRFQIMYDRVHTLNIQGVQVADAAVTTTVKKWVQFYKKVNFTAGIAASGEPNRNRLFALALTDVDEVPAVNISFTIRWTDV